MRIWVCGVRGSTPAPGPEFVRYGGHTSCVAIGRDGEHPTLVLDAGTGIRRITDLTDGHPFVGSVLLGHLHWDHTQGLPFARALDRPDARVDAYVPDQGDRRPAVDVLARAMGPPHFPITPFGLRGTWSFVGLPPGLHVVEGFTVLAKDIPHKGGRTFGYRISDARVSVAYLSDHWPISLGEGPHGLGEFHDAALELCHDADLVFHDAQYTAAELDTRANYGHSAVEYAVELVQKAGARRLLLFHHDPARTDDELDEFRATYGVEPAAEQTVIDL